MVLPFVALLLAIALGPLLCPSVWARHYAKIACALGAITVAYYLLSLQAFARILHVAHEYAGFIALIGSLFVVSGGIHDFDQAEGILARGEADVCAAARQSLADPDWFRKVRAGQGEQIRRCTYTNYCEGLDQKHKQVTCKLWDRLALDAPGVKLTADGKRRLTAPDFEPDAEHVKG